MTLFRRIGVVGLGYAGLPTAALFAAAGLEVIGVDTDPRIRAAIAEGRPPFGEPDLAALLRRVVEAGKLRALAAPEPAEAFIIAVPTPLRPGAAMPQPDLRHVEAAAAAIAPVLAPGTLVVLESTVPVGTTARLAAQLAAARPDLAFPDQAGELAEVQIAHCPERVLPGRILQEVVHNPRLIGGLTRRCAQRAAALYGIIARGPREVTTAPMAELAKLAENAFRDVNIAFANEIAAICDRHGLDPWEAIRLANLHPRVHILEPGPGVGGHCIAVDPWFLAAASPEEARLIRLARAINDARPAEVCARVRAAAAGFARPVIACLGLAYKRDVDDLRGSPAVEIVRRLAEEGIGELLPVEPHIFALPADLAALGLALHDFDRALARADIVLLLVDHAAFRQVDRALLAGRIVIDTRGAWRG